jgi:hypothetical protein
MLKEKKWKFYFKHDIKINKHNWKDERKLNGSNALTELLYHEILKNIWTMI